MLVKYFYIILGEVWPELLDIAQQHRLSGRFLRHSPSLRQLAGCWSGTPGWELDFLLKECSFVYIHIKLGWLPWALHLKSILCPTWTDPLWRGSRERTGAAGGTETVAWKIENWTELNYWWLYENGSWGSRNTLIFQESKVRLSSGYPPKQSGRVVFHLCPSQYTVLSPAIKAPRLHLNLVMKR